MATEISWEIRERAEELYIVDGKTFEEVAALTGVSITQLKRWGSGNAESEIPSWAERKREYRTAFASIRRDTVLLRKRLISKALKSLDPQDVYAISSIENTVAKAQHAGADTSEPLVSKEKRIIKTPEDAVDALGDVVESKINAMLTKPGAISLIGIKEMKQSLELIDKMKTKYKPETKEKEPATEEDKKRLIDEVDKILGVK